MQLSFCFSIMYQHTFAAQGPPAMGFTSFPYILSVFPLICRWFASIFVIKICTEQSCASVLLDHPEWDGGGGGESWG